MYKRKEKPCSSPLPGHSHQDQQPESASAPRYDEAWSFPDESVQEFFETQLGSSPDSIALVFGGQQLTYTELNKRANRIARFLQRLGVGPETMVGICVERSIDMVAALLGTLKAGGGYVPIDISYPKQRLALMLDDAKMSVVITLQHLIERLPKHNAQLVRLDNDWELIGRESDENPSNSVTSQNLAYTIFTSGSTGRPKAVQILHKALSNLLSSMRRRPGLTAEDTFLAITTLSFDMAMPELLLPLCVGARMVILTHEEASDGRRLIKELAYHEATVMQATPVTWRLLLDAGWQGSPQLKMLCGGEALPQKLANQLFKRGASFWNLYGPTETTVWSTIHQISQSEEKVTIGHPVANTQLQIMDPNLLPVATGESGELYIGGAGLARGYLGRPDMTAERFIPNPLSREPGARLYKTGDLTRFGPNGNLEFLGRIDRQVKIRGFRIELEEIETLLKQHPAVQDAAVLAREDIAGTKQLVAYIAPIASGISPELALQLRSYLSARLPEYMLPSLFLTMKALPLTPNGKIDRRALPAPTSARPEFAGEYVAPRSRIERRLAEIWAQVLGLGEVGIHDNFFDLGGNSLQAAVFLNRLQQELGHIVYITALFDAPTIAKLATYLNHRYGEENRSEKINESKVARFRQIVGSARPQRAAGQESIPKNPPAIFILSPPRSGSTLLRVMLNGHPLLFAPPELHLLPFATLKQRRETFSGRQSLWLEGTLRAIMQIKECDSDESRKIMQECEDQQMSTRQFYRLLQEWLVEKRLVDKTPTYALDLQTLRRAEESFENALYIHLMRDPRGMIHSFKEARLDQLFDYDSQFSAAELAELIWVISHQNITEFLAAVPPERQYELKFERLLKEPEEVMQELSKWMGLEFNSGMLKPYEEKEKKMTDGIHGMSRMLGDIKFHTYKGIETGVAERWKSKCDGRLLGKITREVARALGYLEAEAERRKNHDSKAPITSLAPIDKFQRNGATQIPLSFGQQRLWFMNELEPGRPTYNVCRAIRFKGSVDIAAMEQSFNDIVKRHEVLRTTFASVDGQPRQVIASHLKLALTVVDLRSLPETERGLQSHLIANEEGRKRFDLARGPLLRAALLRLGQEEHILVLSLHHIICDGWSMEVLLMDLSMLYNARCKRQPSPLVELPIQYSDFTIWQRKWMQGDIMREQLCYWRKQLEGAPEILALPTDRPRPLVRGLNGATYSLLLPLQITETLNQLSRRERVTLFMALLSVFKVLLYRYSHQEDIVVGTPTANRNRIELEGLIGFFVNTLALRTKFPGSPSFRELLSRVREVALGAYVHQDLPFEKLVEELQPRRSLSHTPLFQSMFVLQDGANKAIELSGLKLSRMEVDLGTAKFDLSLWIRETDQGMKALFEYNIDLFDIATVARMAGHFQTLLGSLVANPDQPIQQAQVLTPAEMEQNLSKWNETAVDYPRDKCIHELFEIQAERTPDSIAVTFAEAQLSYEELNRRANQLARHLRQLGVGPEVLVGICVERSSEMIVGLLGILKARGAYMPLDPRYPAERLRYMLRDGEPRVLLTEEQWSDELPEFDGETVCLDQDWPLIATQSKENPTQAVRSENLAYVLYTSGSTGRPKGVGVANRNIVRLVKGPQDVSVLSSDMVLQAAPLAFDASTFEIWGALLNGAGLTLHPSHIVDIGKLRELIERERISVVWLTAGLFHRVVEESLSTLSGVRMLLSGGEALSVEHVRRVVEQNSGRRMINGYGPTECTTFSSWYEVKELGADARTVPIGRPLANGSCYVLDEAGNPVPVGVVGELYIGGEGVARGYVGMPEQTGERFIPNPFSKDGGERLYRSGDLVRWRKDGNLDFVGRVDDQVKIRGHRIEPGEVEAALREHPEIQETAVLVREDVAGEKRLVGYVVWRKDAVTDVREVRRYLKQRLPEYMLPSALVALERLPLTPNGKLDRKALPGPEGWQEAVSYLAPRAPMEEMLARIWAELLRVDRVGVHDNFFDLGGHSLIATSMTSRVRSEIGIELPVQSVFEAPTLEALAERINVMHLLSEQSNKLPDIVQHGDEYEEGII